MAENFKLGMNAKLYTGDAAITTPVDDAVIEAITWTVVGVAQDLEIGGTTETDDITARGNSGFVATVATLIDKSLTFGMRYDTTDTAFGLIETAYKNRATIPLLIMDQDKDVAGARGFAANFVITDLSETQNLREAIKASVTAQPQSGQYFYTKSGS
jgi:hypothetical protein